MIKKLTLSAFCAIFSLVPIYGQQDEIPVNEAEELKEAEQLEQDYKDAWKTAVITDEMTVDPEQNKSWRMGEYKFSAKPKNCWELGFHFGHFFIDGDVDTEIPGGYGVGLHLRKAVNYVLSLRGSVFYGKAKGFETQPYRHRNQVHNGIGGGLVESPTFDAYDPELGGPGHWFPAYQTMYVSADLAAVLNIGNLLFHKERNKWNWYMAIGVGLDHHTANLDLLDSNGLPYMSLQERIGWTRDEFNTQAGRKRIKSDLGAIYDGVYESEGFKKEGIFRIGDDFNIHVVFVPSMGISRKISKRLNIGIEHQIFLTDNDYLDGIRYRTAVDQTNNVDIGHYTHVRVGLNLGNFSKVTEPLYWLNPIDAAFNDIANLKNKPSLDLADEDYDGVIDILDQELNTKEDCPVDTRGVILDSDGDGIVDCEDKEPYSRPGCKIDEFGVAQCEKECCADEDEVNKLIDRRTEDIRNSIVIDPAYKAAAKEREAIETTLSDLGYEEPEVAVINKMIDSRIEDIVKTVASNPAMKPAEEAELNRLIDTRIQEIKNSVSTEFPDNQSLDETLIKRIVDSRINEIKLVNTPKSGTSTSGGNTTTYVSSACGSWFLPMIHYDLNKSTIKPEYYSHLHNVAQVMNKCPEICVVVSGHTDTRSNNAYNRVLSYKRAKEAVDYLVNHYGIDRERLKLMYGGEESPMVTAPTSEAHHFMNRRVEFRTCEANDFEMEAPADYNPNAKTATGTGGYYKGNKSSGY